jgi:formylglycine-generating enzyme required for sulfatase activity
MPRATSVVKAMAILAAFAGMSVAGVKYVAVVEMEIDMEPSEKMKLKTSEVRLITDELRNAAVKTLPRDQYSVMTTETVMKQSGAVLDECHEENCVITLGSKIGADYIVRGKLGKIETQFTLSVSMYDTEDGFLVGSMNTIRAGKLVGLLVEAPKACENMFKTFLNPQGTGTAAQDVAQTTQSATNNVSGAASRGNIIDDKVGIEMAFVKGGTFRMGCTAEQSDDCLYNEKPAHSVTVSDFYIGKYEVTQKLWVQVMGGSNNPSLFKGDNLPVEKVSWNDVQEFILRLNSITGKKYRLPTEAEWEYAARGGENSNGYKYSGSNNPNYVAWYNVNSGDMALRDGLAMEYVIDKNDMDSYDNIMTSNKNRTWPVGTKASNGLGIYDMSGNVCEWVNDWYGNYSSAAQTNPKGPSSGSGRVIRGGNWSDDAVNCRVFYRFFNGPGIRIRYIGFRLVLSP